MYYSFSTTRYFHNMDDNREGLNQFKVLYLEYYYRQALKICWWFTPHNIAMYIQLNATPSAKNLQWRFIPQIFFRVDSDSNMHDWVYPLKYLTSLNIKVITKWFHDVIPCWMSSYKWIPQPPGRNCLPSLSYVKSLSMSYQKSPWSRQAVIILSLKGTFNAICHTQTPCPLVGAHVLYQTTTCLMRTLHCITLIYL